MGTHPGHTSALRVPLAPHLRYDPRMKLMRGTALTAMAITTAFTLTACYIPLDVSADESTATPVESVAVTTEAPAPIASVTPTTTAAPEPAVPSEWAAALKSAEGYLDFTSFSKQALYDQLTSEYGDQFPADAAQYAVDNVVVDWNAEALEAAISYRELFSMSNAELWDQLTSEYGGQFTAAEADYAVANLP